MRAARVGPQAGGRGFTLLELAIVVGIIAVLIGILLPALGRARAQAYAVRCGSNLRQVGTSLVAYASGNRGECYPYRNWGRWKDPANPVRQIRGSHAEAYWGVAYAEFGGFGKDVFNCPSATDTDPASADGTFADGNVYACYGLNGYYGGGSGKTDAQRQAKALGPAETALFRRVGSEWFGRSVIQMPRASEVVFAQDSYEAVLDGNGDTFDNWSQWVGKEPDYLRHFNASNAVFADGHVASLTRQEQSNSRIYSAKN